jgi:two-component sensor histidine kinase
MVRETGKQTLDPKEFEERIRERIIALSRSHDLLVTSEWSGASLFDLVQEHLKPFGHDDQISLSGPLITLQPNAVQYLGIAFHELGTNSSKHGALSNAMGAISVSWRIVRSLSGACELELVWEERSVPHSGADQPATGRRGFGTIVLQRVTPQALSGSAVLDKQAGLVRWTLAAPISSVAVDVE